MRVPALIGIVVGVSALAVEAGCKCGGDAAPTPIPSAAAPSAPARPDRIDPNDLAEGTDKAFDLKIPRGMQVTIRAPNEVDAVGRLPAEKIANYVRKRIEAETVELGAARTVFNRAKVKGEPTGRWVRIEVELLRDTTTRLVVRDLSPPKVDPTLTPEERWKQFGLDPHGGVMDPTHQE